MSSPVWIGGIHTISTVLLNTPERILTIYVSEQRKDAKIEMLINNAKTQSILLQKIQQDKLNHLLPGINHQGVAAKCRSLPTYTEHDLNVLLAGVGKAPFVLVLDGVQDPHNLGACLRSAEAAGVHAVIIPKDRAASITPTVRKVACGAAELVPLITATNLSRALLLLQETGVFLTGFADDASKNLYEADLTGALGLVLGAEEQGLRRLTREKCDTLVHIPMAGAISSLNVSVATGIGLYEAVRQRSLSSQ